MEPENVKPDEPGSGTQSRKDDRTIDEPRASDSKRLEGEAAASAADEPADSSTEPKTTDSKTVGPKPAERSLVVPRNSDRALTDRKFSQVSRRELLKVAPVLALAAFAIPRAQEWLLNKGLGFSDWASARMFRSGHLATTFADSELTPFEKFPINGYDVDDPGVIFENWTLTVTGLVQKPGDYKMEQIQTLPLTRQNTRHVCVEGWDVIGRFGGTRLSNFLNMIGADTTARFISVICADDYYETLDMATALHPQTLLCWEMYDRPLTREHGAPLRLNVPTKIGYKNAKYLTDLKVTNVVDKFGYWEDQGYSEFYGL